MTESEKLRDALENMVWQFAYRGVINEHRNLSTGGLSALEEAFGVLDWADPHYPPETIGCAAEGCDNWGSAGTPTVDGYRHFCSDHSKEWREASDAYRADRAAADHEQGG